MTTSNSEPLCRKIGPDLFKDVKAWIESLFHFDEPMDAALVTLMILQTRVYQLLPTVFYLFVMGKPGSGKTCLLNAMAMLGRGRLLGDITPAAMARELGRGRDAQLDSSQPYDPRNSNAFYHLGCFDEYDSEGNRERHAAMDELLRHGYRRDGAPYVRWDMERGKARAYNLYMPKAAAATSTLDPAQASRGFKISAVPYEEPDGFVILLNNRYPKGMKELVQRLDEWADAVRQHYTRERVEELEKSSEHAERVKAITGRLGLNRKNEHALTCATIAEMAGIDIKEELQHGIRTLSTANEEDEDEIEELNVALLSIVEQQRLIQAADTITVKQAAVKALINEERRLKNLKPLGNKRFATIYRAAGIRESWVRGRGGKNYWVVPVLHLKKVKGLLNSPNSVNLDEELDQHTSKVGRVDRVGSESTCLEGGPLEDRVRRACQMHRDGLGEDEIKRAVGYEVAEHCYQRGLIPRVGGQER